jgi:predicted metal-dependent peptidase
MPDSVADSDGLHRHRGTRAIQRMVEFAPSTGGLALWVRHEDLPATMSATGGGGAGDVPAVTTDGRTIFYGPRFERLGLESQTGLVAHEVLHIALRHAQRYGELLRQHGDVDLHLFNICADAIVNSTLSHLSWLKLPTGAVVLERLLTSVLQIDQAVERSLLEWDVERLYRAIDDRRLPEQASRGGVARPQGSGGHSSSRGPQGSGGQSGSSSKSGLSGKSGSTADAVARTPVDARLEADSREGTRTDGPRAARTRALGAEAEADLLPGPASAGPPEAQAAEAREWSERIVRAHAGDGVHSMLRALIADLPMTRTPWQHLLRTQLSRGLAPKPALSWSRPTRSYIANQGRGGAHRRLPWEPGFSRSQSVPRLVVIVDVSGSIEDALMERFAREIEAITRRLEAGLVVIIGDDRVRRVEHFEPGVSDLRGIEFSGGGGTDFTPMLEEADLHRPDITVVLTDLDGPARYRPRWPVIWAVPDSQRTAIQPFGRKILLN